MCDVGLRVATVEGSVYGDGSPAPPNRPGIIVGHWAEWALVSLDGQENTTVLVPEGRARVLRQPGQKPGRSRPRREVVR